MNRSTKTALIALFASIAFIGKHANAQETINWDKIEPFGLTQDFEAPQPDDGLKKAIKSWEELAAEQSHYDLNACNNQEYARSVCRPEIQADGSYAEVCQMMRVECGVLIPETENDNPYRPYTNPWVSDETDLSPYDTDWMFENDTETPAGAEDRDSSETEVSATPEIKSWEELADEHSNYDSEACYYGQESSERICRPKLEANGSYSEECQTMRAVCGMLIPENIQILEFPESYDPWHPGEGPSNWPAESTGAYDIHWANEDFTPAADQSVLDFWSEYDAANTE